MTSQTIAAQPQSPTQAQTDTMTGLHSLYLQVLREIYNGENQIVQALPVMMASATNHQLQQGFKLHLEQSKVHVQRLENIFQSLGENPNGMTCKGINSLIGEGQMLIKMRAPGALLDIGLIAIAQHIEHYEIATYGTLWTWAVSMGHEDHSRLLEETLEEEKLTDGKLSQMGKGLVS